MAWEHFPVARGQRLTADMLNELAIAWNERGGSVGLFTRGQRIKNAVSTFLSGLRTAIRNSLSQWYHITRTSESSFSVKALTADASSAETQNVFELALGPGITNWRGSVNSGRLTAEVLNDIYRVLDVLRVKAMSDVKAYCYQKKKPVEGSLGDIYLCAESNGEPASLAQDAKPWMGPYLRSEEPLTRCELLAILDYPLVTYMWETSQARTAARSQITIPAARRLYLLVHAGASRYNKYLSSMPGIGRNITLYVRHGAGTADISSVVSAAAWGSPLWSHTFPPGTRIGKWETVQPTDYYQFLLKLDNPPTGAYSFVAHADLDLSHHGAGLHNLSYWNGYWKRWDGWIEEWATLKFWRYFVEPAYSKVTG